MMAIAEEITAQKEYNYARLEAQIIDAEGNIIEEYSTEYDCNDLDACPEGISFQTILIALGIIIISITIIALMRRHIGLEENEEGRNEANSSNSTK